MAHRIIHIGLLAVLLSAGVSCSRENLDYRGTADGGGSRQEVPFVCRATFENEVAGVEPNVYSEETLESARRELALQTKNGTKYVIPVVFHVFGTTFNDGTAVTYETIVQALKTTNEDFQGRNPYDSHKSTVSGDYGIEFEPYEFMAGIEFRLANIDPDGNYTTGVNFYPELSGFGNGGGYDEQIRRYAWDNTRYMNVYIMRDLYGDRVYNNSGVAWYPDSYMTRNNTARVVFNGSYLDGNNPGMTEAEFEQMKKEVNGNSAWNYRNENFRSVLTHEFGHWLDLPHTFDSNDCVPYGHNGKSEYELGDGVPDTPMVAQSLVAKDHINCRGEITNWQNFMNYTDQYANFTADQCARMIAALNDKAAPGTRMSIWQNADKVLLPWNKAGISIDGTGFSEDPGRNDGTFRGFLTLTLVGDNNFVGLSGSDGDDFSHRMTVSGLPAGLKLKLERISNNKLKLSVSGKAAAHEKSDGTTVEIRFDHGLLANSAISFEQDNYALNLKMIDAYRYIHRETNGKVTADTPYTLLFNEDYDVPALTVRAEKDALLVDGLNALVLCEGKTRNVKPYFNGAKIGPGTEMRAITASAKPLIAGRDFSDWKGQTGYLAFGVPSHNGAVVYGWLKISVDKNGTSADILETGYHTAPDMEITVGADEQGKIDPTADFDAVTRSVRAGETVQFVDKSYPEAGSYRWQFEGGSPAASTGRNPQVKFGQAGNFTVTLTVDGSLTKTKTGFISVRDTAVPDDKDDEEEIPQPPAVEEPVAVEKNPATVLGIGDRDPVLKAPEGTIITIYRNGRTVKRVKCLSDGAYEIGGLSSGSYAYIYELDNQTISKGMIEIIK